MAPNESDAGINNVYGVADSYSSPDTEGRMIDLSPMLRLPYESANDVWSVYGKRGSGKSYFLGKLCEELHRLNIPFCIIDVKNAHNQIVLEGLTHSHMTKIAPGQLVSRLGAGESFIISCKGATVDELREFVISFCTIIARVEFGPTYGRPVVIALEECHNFVGQGQGTAGGDANIRSQCTSAVDKLIREGRQDGIGAVLISQSVANVMANIRRQAEIKIIFNIKDSTDINQLRKTLIGKTKRDVEAIIERVYNFKVGEFVCVSPTYIGGAGVIIDKTSPRITRHAGRSFLEGDSNPPLPLGVSPDIPYLFPDTVDTPSIDILSEHSEAPDEDMPTEVFSAKDKPFIDYKSALGLSLLALSVVGMAIVVIKRHIDKRDIDREQELEFRFNAEKRRLDAIKQQQQPVNPNTQNIGDQMEAQFWDMGSPSEYSPLGDEGPV